MSSMSKQDADVIGKALQQSTVTAKRLPALPARGDSQCHRKGHCRSADRHVDRQRD
jgi:hypothetical protein